MNARKLYSTWTSGVPYLLRFPIRPNQICSQTVTDIYTDDYCRYAAEFKLMVLAIDCSIPIQPSSG